MNYVSTNTVEIHVHRDRTGDDHGTEFHPNTADGWIPTEVMIHNARSLSLSEGDDDDHLPTKMNLERNGFELLPQQHIDPTIDFLDSQQVWEMYYPHCEQILKDYFRSDGIIVEVRAFDHNIRINQRQTSTDGRKNELKSAGVAKTQTPLGMVHGDYTKDSGPRRLYDLGQPPKVNDVWKDRIRQPQQGEEQEEEKQQYASLFDPTLVQQALDGQYRFALINVWRNIDMEYPVQEFPLACMDAQQTMSDELRTLYIHYADRVGENYFVTTPTSSTRHPWYYYPEMTHDEVLLIKQWDSHGDFAQQQKKKEEEDGGDEGEEVKEDSHDRILPPIIQGEKNKETTKPSISTFCIHSAFVDPTSSTNILVSSLPTKNDSCIITSSSSSPRPRRSIEVRCALIWRG